MQDDTSTWSGTARYLGTVYVVTVVAPSDSWTADVHTALKTAGGFDGILQFDRTPKPEANELPYGARFSVTFTPKLCYPEISCSR